MKTCTRPLKNDSPFCLKYCPYCKNDFGTVTSLPLVKPRDYSWVNEAGLTEEKTYKMCGQLNLYFSEPNNCTPLQVMDALARKNFNIDSYVNM